MDALCVKNLQKSYGKKTVLKGIDLCVPKGNIFALLGVNGAGKTTTLECIEGLRKYDSGNIEINGRIGIQLQSASLPAYIKGMEAVRLFAKWNRVSVDTAMLTALGVSDLANKQYQGMSTGQKRRLHLALALIRNPDIVFLDEPTAFLDFPSKAEMMRILRHLAHKERKTVMLSTHDINMALDLADSLWLVDKHIGMETGTTSALAESGALARYFAAPGIFFDKAAMQFTIKK